MVVSRSPLKRNISRCQGDTVDVRTVAPRTYMAATALPEELLAIILTTAASASVNDARQRRTWEALRCVCTRAKALADGQAVNLIKALVLRLEAVNSNTSPQRRTDDLSRLNDFCIARGINLEHNPVGRLLVESLVPDNVADMKVRCTPCKKLFRSYEFALKHWNAKHKPHLKDATEVDVTSYLKMRLKTFNTILVAYADYDKATALRRARKLRKTILAGSDFDLRKLAKPKEIQRRFTTLAKIEARSKGGAGTLVEVCELPLALKHAAASLDIGAVSPEIETGEGVHLLMRTA